MNGEDGQPIHVVRIMPSKALDFRIIGGMVFIVVLFLAGAFGYESLQHQLDGFRQQIAVTNAHLAGIQKQECLDTNAATQAFILEHHPDPAPTLRKC